MLRTQLKEAKSTTKGSSVDQISERAIFLPTAAELTLKANAKSFEQLCIFTWIRLYHCNSEISQTN